MKRYLIRISFLGINFYGTQKQKDDVTIQGIFERFLSKIYDQKIKVAICSRLDKDVSANDFVLTYDDNLNKDLDIEHVRHFLSKQVGDDIFIKEIKEVDPSFSARYSCLYKEYLYLIQNSKFNPLLNSFTYPYKRKKIDIDEAKKVVSLFKGEHDFRYFASLEEEDEKTILTILDSSIEEKNDFIQIRFKGKSFLRYQVRMMVGAIIRHDENRLSLEQIKELLEGKKVRFQRLTVPGKGLILDKIVY